MRSMGMMKIIIPILPINLINQRQQTPIACYPRSSRLNHLIDGAIAPGEILVGKAKSDVVDDFRFLEGQQCLVVAARG